MTKQPLLFCSLFFVLGILGQDFFQWNGWAVGAGLGLSIIGLGLGLIKSIFFDRIKSVFLLLFFAILGSFCHFLNSQRESFSPPIVENKTQNIVFQLTKKLNSNEKNKRYEVEVINYERPFSVVISIPKEQEELDFRHYYSAKAYLNPTQKPQHDYQFDYQKHLARQDIFYQGYIPNSFSKTPRNEFSFFVQIKQWRLDLLQKIENSTLSPQNQSLLKGIILADRTEIDRDIINNFSQTGLIHILAISGTHMGIIFFLILSLFKPIFSVKYRHFPIYISLFCIWLFALFIGFGNSVVRSCLMISLYYAMFVLQRKPSTLHTLGLSALFILIIDTQQVFNIGFQLSFLAVLGIFGFYRPIVRLFGKQKNIAIKWLVNTFALTISAQIAVLPLTIFYFNQFSPMAIIFNIPAIAFAQIFIALSFLICGLFGLNFTPNISLNFYDNFASFFLKMVKFFADIDFSFSPNISLSLWEVGILFGILYFLRKIVIQLSIKNTLNLTFAILIFISARSFLDFYHWQEEEILEHQLFRQNVISIKQGEHCTFIINENSDLEKIKQYIISPYTTQKRVKHWEIKTLAQSKISLNGKICEVK